MTEYQEEKTLDSIYNFWFPTDGYQNFWFDASVDNYIKKNYLQLLKKEEDGCFDNLTELKQLLSRIILLDQFTRNIYRGTPAAYKNDSKALSLSMSIINNNHLNDYKFNEAIFILMPLRHTKELHYLEIVRSFISLSRPATPEEKLLHHKFKHATFAAYSDLEDQIKTFRYDIPAKITDQIELTKSYSFIYNPVMYNTILDDNCDRWVSVAVGSDEEVANHKLYKTMEKYFKKDSIVAVSLSGGVDSMVILDICRHLRSEGKIKAVWAIHMEYINREDDSPKETQFLKEYCEGLAIPIVVRKIDYMSREDVDREFYEEQTKRARFTTYRYMMRQYGIETFCLGHHSGDLGENVLMNIFKGRDILDLFVMDETDVQLGVPLSRPLLSHPKSDIYDYSEEFHIPYFTDTTPNWSCRGVLRRKIIPRLESQWGYGIHQTLAAVGKQSSEWGAVIDSMIIQPFLKAVEWSDCGKKFSFAVTHNLLNQPHVFWHKILMHLFHKKGCKMISHKNLDSMLSMLKKRFDSRDSLKLTFSNGCLGEFKKNKLYII